MNWKLISTLVLNWSLFLLSAIGVCHSLSYAQPPAPLGGVEVKSRTAPAIVRIETGRELGTGFFFRPEGWILTNYHVVKDAPVDPKTGKPFVRLTYGELDIDGQIQEQDQTLWASVYRLDRRADLALLLLDAMPSGKSTVPFIPFASDPPKDGENCFALGMPVAGMKWDLRDGKVSSQGLYPDNVSIELDNKLQPSPQRRAQLLRWLAPEGSVQMIVTTCGINPGDSGGPILNAEGKLIAITKAIPKSTQEGVRLDKISYHIHLAEIKKFVATLPTSPELLPPYSMPRNAELEVLQSKKTGARLYEFQDTSEQKLSLFIDFDQSSAAITDQQQQSLPELSELELWKQLGIEWAIVKDFAKPTCHYFDLDQNGVFETVFQNALDDGEQPKCYKLDGSVWRLEICERNFLDNLKFSSQLSQDVYDNLQRELPPRYTK